MKMMTKFSTNRSYKNANLSDYDRIEQAIDYLSQNYHSQPDLQVLADYLRLSPFHVQRLFHRWAGISPKQFTGYLTLQYAKGLLKGSKNVLDSTLDAGLSSPGRLHDLFVSIDACSPGEFKSAGQGMTIRYGLHPTLFGLCLIAETDRGVCHLSFWQKDEIKEAHQQLSKEWKNAKIVQDQKSTKVLIQKIFEPKRGQSFKLFLKGTNFQLKVWEALLKIPKGSVISYENLAQSIQKPTATRAVSRAVAMNAVSYLIPCHRVIHKSGAVDGYRWRTVRKRAMLIWESAKKEM